MRFSCICAGLGLLGILGLISCNDSSSMMMEPSGTTATETVAAGSQAMICDPPELKDPTVMVNGKAVRVMEKDGTGAPTLFRVRVVAPCGLSTIRKVMMQYSQPGSKDHGEKTQGLSGTVACHDDGSYGDNSPGDGIYHYMDPKNQIGCDGLKAPHGEYHYSFWCEDDHGQRSETVSVTVVRR